MSTTTTESPRYRVIAKDGAFINGSLHPMGAQVTFDGWPRKPAELEPISPGAIRIARYYARHQALPGLPRSPWSATYQCIWLPGLDLQYAARRPCPIHNPKGSEIMGLVLDKDVDAGLPAMPEYEMRVEHRIGRHVLQAGERFRFIGWPIAELMEPANHPARLVAEFFAANHEHPKLEPRGPWNWYAGLHLPELPELVRGAGGKWHAPAQPATLPWATKAYPAGDYKPLDTVKYADAIASEIEGVTGKRPGTPGAPPVSTPSGFKTHVNKATKPYLPRPFAKE